LIGCQKRGGEAYRRGDSRDSCPYQTYNKYATGPANLTRQRREYWIRGWDFAKEEDDKSS